MCNGGQIEDGQMIKNYVDVDDDDLEINVLSCYNFLVV